MLSERIRCDYELLINELTCRYRTVEQRRTMGAKFSHHEWLVAENVQNFAVHSKMLYDKAHPNCG